MASLRRRQFLPLAFAAMTTVGRDVVARDPARAPTLVVVFLRGAMDALSVVAPYGDDSYYRARSELALPPPGRGAGASLRLDDRFALHPNMPGLHRIYREGRVAFVVATGLPSALRSHFEAQYLMEHGGRAEFAVPEHGWLARVDRQLGGDAPVRALSVGGAGVAASLVGTEAVAAGRREQSIDDPKFRRALERMYGGASGVAPGAPAMTAQAGARGLAAADHLASLSARHDDVRDADFPRDPLGRTMRQVARWVRLDPGIRLVSIDAGGWDTHTNQVRRLEGLTRGLDGALTAFVDNLGAARSRVCVLVMSEFGRTVAGNGTKGTDHGWATAAWLIGDRVRGGIHGRWPGLAPGQLFQGRDVAVTTDYRDVLSAVANQHLETPLGLPGFRPSGLRLFRS
ncbi:MAG: DUF1501 domain-containing protein [Myxococcota bacterium]